MRTLLKPAAAIYGAVAARRLARSATYTARIPVICAGNFTAGGTGKTPFTAYLAELLTRGGARPAILSRGHGGRIAVPHWVNAASDTAADVGDEPLQHALMAPTLVARDRADGARAIEQDQRGFTHIVMDDGLQNSALSKSLSFALVDGRRGIGNGCVIPAGPLRAPLAAQVPLADVIVVNHGFAATSAALDTRQLPALAAFEQPILHATIAPSGDTAWLAAGSWIAFAGIGTPRHMFDMLRALGAHLTAEIAYPDHHRLTDTEARALLAQAARSGASLVTTEKDLARLSGTMGACGELRAAARAVPIRMHFSTDDVALIDARLAGLDQGGRT